MKKIIINERGETALFKHLLNEEVTYMGDKEDVVLKWLNNHFKAIIKAKTGVSSMTELAYMKYLSELGFQKLCYLIQFLFTELVNKKKKKYLSNSMCLNYIIPAG